MQKTKRNYASRKLDQFVVRLPDGMRDEIFEAAKKNNRSMNAEIVARLSESVIGKATNPATDAIRQPLAELLIKVEHLTPIIERLSEMMFAAAQPSKMKAVFGKKKESRP